MEHHGHQVWKLDLGNPSWCLGHYYSAWARSWAFKCIRALCIDLTGCSVLADLSNYLSFVQLTWYCWSTFLALGAVGSSWGICGLVLRMGSWDWLYWVSVCLVSFKCFMFATGVTFFTWLDLTFQSGSFMSLWVRLCLGQQRGYWFLIVYGLCRPPKGICWIWGLTVFVSVIWVHGLAV